MKATTGYLLLLLLVTGSTATPATAQQPCSGGPPPTAVIDWPEFRFDLCHSSFIPYEFVLSTTSVGSLALDWKYATEGQIFVSSPAVANGIVYVGSDDNNVYALNASTGALLWQYMTGDSVDSSPAMAKGVVYVGSEDNNLYAFHLPNH